MFAHFFISIPDDLSAAQRAHWQRRQRTAQNALEVQALAGTVVNAETVASFQRYVKGEIALNQAITQVRQQAVQEQQRAFQQYFNRRNSI